MRYTFLNVEIVATAPQVNLPLECAVAVGNPGREIYFGSSGTSPGQVGHATAREHGATEVLRQHCLAQEAKRVEDRTLAGSVGANEDVEIAGLDVFIE